MQMILSRNMHEFFVPFTDRAKNVQKTHLLSNRDFSHLYELSSLEFTLYASDQLQYYDYDLMLFVNSCIFYFIMEFKKFESFQ